MGGSCDSQICSSLQSVSNSIYISHDIYMAHGLINAMIKLLIVYFIITGVEEFININMHKLIKH